MNGWNHRQVSRIFGIVAMLNFIQPLSAADQAIDPELLEFLGEWETEEGEWVDPAQMEDSEEEIYEQAND